MKDKKIIKSFFLFLVDKKILINIFNAIYY